MKPRVFIKTMALALAFGAVAGTADARPKTPHRAPPQTHVQAHHDRADRATSNPGGKAANYAAMVLDASDGHVLYERNGQAHLRPASTTKIMTAYLVFEALRDGRLSMDQRIPVSRNAAGQPRTNLGMMSSVMVRDPAIPGHKPTRHKEERQTVTSITVENAIRGMLCHSANDAAVVLAEAIGGSEAEFVRMMNAKAEELGLANTHYANPNGLPAGSQVTTPEDLARLSRAVIRDFPENYALFDITSFTFNGVTYRNTNNLLGHYDGLDGIKTGWIATSGYNLAASARRGDTRVIGVVFGARSPVERRDDMTALLDFGFKKIARPDSVFAFGPPTASDTGDRYIVIPPKAGDEDAPPPDTAANPAATPAPGKTALNGNAAVAGAAATYPLTLAASFRLQDMATAPFLAPGKPAAPDQPPQQPSRREPMILPRPPKPRNAASGGNAGPG